MEKAMNRCLRALPLIVLAGLAGCGSNTATVSGKVTYQGRPVTSGTVIALNPDGTAKSWVILPDSTYMIEGVQKGHVKFGVFSPDPVRATSILKGKKGVAKESADTKAAERAGWFPLPPELGDPEKSGLACDVSTSHVQYDLELK